MSLGNIHVSGNQSVPPLPSVREAESQNILLPTDVNHRDDVAYDIDIDPDFKVTLFMENDAAVKDLHPGNRTPEKGFFARHKALGIFLIGASSILIVGLIVAGIGALIGGVIGGIALGGLLGGVLGAVLGGAVGSVLMASSNLFIKAIDWLVEETFTKPSKDSSRMNTVFQSLQKQIPMESEQARMTKNILKELEVVQIGDPDRFQSVAEVDFLIKYSELPQDLKHELLARFFRERMKGVETSKTLLQLEEMEFECTQMLHNGRLLDTLSTRLQLENISLPIHGSEESWEDYCKDIFALVKEDKFYQALPQERRDEIEALSSYPATQLFYVTWDLQAVHNAIRSEAKYTILGEEDSTPGEEDSTPIARSYDAQSISEWLQSKSAQKRIKERLSDLNQSKKYRPIIPRSPIFSGRAAA